MATDSGDAGPAPRSVIGAVLAGGSGSRIGGQKATVELCGRPLIAYPLAAIELAGMEPLVVAKPETELPPLECRAVLEPESPRHPLCGIVAALRAAAGRPVVVIACDMPLVEASLLAYLASASERLVVPFVDGQPQPLVARYEPALLEELEAAMAAQEPLRRTVAALAPRQLRDSELSQFGDPARIFFNVNESTDLRRAEDYLGGRAACKDGQPPPNSSGDA